VAYERQTKLRMLEGESTRLTVAMNNRKLDDIGTTEVLVTATCPKIVRKIVSLRDLLNHSSKKSHGSSFDLLYERQQIILVICFI